MDNPSKRSTPISNDPTLSEKPHGQHIEMALDASESGIRDPVAEKRLIRRVDWRLMPTICVLYALSLIDRTNIGAARVDGMARDLKMIGNDHYSIALLVFFPGYFLMELPSNLIIRKAGTANWLSFIILVWGAITVGMGFTESWITMSICRALLGIFEAGLFPGCVYLISCWYQRYEVQKRLSIFYMSSVLASGFAGILAYGLGRLNGRQGIEGWRWIFIVEGAITMAAAIFAWFFIVDFPQKAKFLTEHERALIDARMNDDRGDAAPEALTASLVMSHLADWQMWAYSLMFMCNTAAAYSLAYFIPVILKGLGYSTALSQILTAPPYILAIMLSLVTSWWSDKTRTRVPYILFQAVLSILGYTLVWVAPNTGGKLVGTFLAVAGVQPNQPNIISWMQNNIRGTSKRAVGAAMQAAMGAIGGIAASTVFREKDAPGYHNGLLAIMIFQVGVIGLTLFLYMYNRAQNKKLDRELGTGVGFRYTL
ncbi:hypothetical protein YB2330_003964 [Saitoella coloradoensis]